MKKDATPLCWDQRLTVAVGSGEGGGAARSVVPSPVLFLSLHLVQSYQHRLVTLPQGPPFHSMKGKRSGHRQKEVRDPEQKALQTGEKAPGLDLLPRGRQRRVGDCQTKLVDREEYTGQLSQDTDENFIKWRLHSNKD